MEGTIKTAVFWLVMVIAAALLWQVVRSTPRDQQSPEISYSKFISQAQAGEIERVTITGPRIDGEYRNGKGNFRLTGPTDPGPFLAILQDKGVEIRFRAAEPQSLPMQLLGTWAPLILLGALWFFMIRQMRDRSRPPGATGSGIDTSGNLR